MHFAVIHHSGETRKEGCVGVMPAKVSSLLTFLHPRPLYSMLFPPEGTSWGKMTQEAGFIPAHGQQCSSLERNNSDCLVESQKNDHNSFH